MAQSQGWVRRYAKAFCKGFFVAVPVAVTFLDRVACVARVEGASMQPSLNPGGSQSSDVVLLNHWKVRNFEVQRGDIVSLVQQEASVEGPRATFQASKSRKQLSGFLRQAGVRTELEPAPNRKADSAVESRSPARALNKLRSPKNPEQKIIKRVIALEGDIVKTIGHKNRYVKVPRGHIWVEGDHHGHSFDSNSFGPVSLGLLHAHATHILWPPERWQKLESALPPERLPVQREEE
ncbi:mitochondrial inner membrane protease subunit 2 isoform X1 [Zalophus californianus]|uniref:Mitochondrial inner membrane protease subunit 2 isoform X1 n=1 Tax=Zalophus californianus TaxID=9704 RepID=A0A6J2BFK8_ZALCA|nr:mitochondrial inner membrane protease subunit 2 isoform X1 [Zalophus californianus]XP_027430671.1 mitochondrial inner membrane protease subunit 2 isoform X1 [Zalophus californianus]XP_027430673.1 mitochondrial inner membrane protease subunit 2 isoform X1 [Zalophus californianus]XP_027430674.1 mitochondrial inner membrane protease subunit 2 isoform X1 [Zalophus californianus]